MTNRGLTLREFEIYMLIVGKAKCRQTIADELRISKLTVGVHVSHIMDKMGMSTCLELLVQYHKREQGK